MRSRPSYTPLYATILILYFGVSALSFYLLNHGGVRALFVLMCLISGAFLVWLFTLLYRRENLTFSHIIFSWIIVNSTALLWGVMYLAVTDHVQIAETLGRYIVTDLLGTTGAIMIKALVENLSKNNHWPDKVPRVVSQDPPRVDL